MFVDPTRPAGRNLFAHEHIVHFYERQEYLADRVADFLAENLRQGGPALVVATDEHTRAITAALESKQIDLAALIDAGRLTLLDAGDLLASLLVDGIPDEARFAEVLGARISSAASSAPHVQLRIYGEMVDLLWQNRNAAAAIRVEDLWNRLAESYGFSLFCAYDLAAFGDPVDGPALDDVCERHTVTIPAESFDDSWSEEKRRRAVLDLQRRARAFDVATEQRKALEEAVRSALAGRREAEQARFAALNALQAAESGAAQTVQSREEQVRALVHSLRTPLNVILGWAQMAELKSEPAILDRALGAIRRNAQQLARLLDGLDISGSDAVPFDVSRGAAG